MADSRWHTARKFARTGDATSALSSLGDAVRRSELDAPQLERAGAMARKLIGDAASAQRIAVLSECTTHWLANTLAAVALGEGRFITLYEGGYDSVLQELHGAALRDFAPNVVVLLPWYRASTDERPLSERVAHWRAVQEGIVSRFGAGIVQIGFDWIDPGPQGFHLATAPGGVVASIRSANDELRAGLPKGSYFVDLPAVSGDMGRRAFYDARRYFWTKQPFSEQGVDWLARHIWAGARAISTGPKKLLALDLDNTLWGGVVGEVGADGIELGDSAEGEAFRELQRYAKRLTTRGVVLAVTSKNNEEDAKAPFLSNRDMQLSLDDFVAFEAHWQDKSESLARAAQRLKLGTDSFVFVDDNPTEREEVRQRAGSVCVVDLPVDPAEYTRALTRELWFEAVAVTGEDTTRTEQYLAEARREDVKNEHASVADYLTSLELRADVRDVDEADKKRVLQLIGKTNQFNVTTPRYSRAELEAILQLERAFGLSLRLKDRFGDYGLILLVIGRPAAENTLEIDTFLMSCRAIARSVEEFAWGKVLERARALGYERIIGVHRPTAKNALVADLYPRLGLTLLSSTERELRYGQLVADAQPPISFVRDHT